MDERLIMELNAKVNTALATCEQTGIALVALQNVFSQICAPLLAAGGVTLQDIDDLHTRLSTEAFYLSIKNETAETSDRWTAALSAESERIVARLRVDVEIALIERERAAIARERAALDQQREEMDRRPPSTGFWAFVNEKKDDA